MGLNRCQERKIIGDIRADPILRLLTLSMIMAILGLVFIAPDTALSGQEIAR